MTADKHSGGCRCGAVTYEAEGAPRWVAHCHCHSCRRSTGAPITTYAGYESSGFRWVKGEPAEHNSSPGVVRTFCGTCGTPLTFASSRWPDEIHIHISTLERPEDFPPTAHVYTEEGIDWFKFDDGLPRHPRSGDG